MWIRMATWMPLVLGPAGLRVHNHPVSLPVSACIGTLGPFVGCFIAHRMQTGNWRAVRLLPRSPFANDLAHSGAALRASLYVSAVSRVHFKRRPQSMALAYRGSGGAMGANV